MTTINPKSERHPCFNKDAKGSYGRVHLPVAPRCNIQCNFCNRRYDCVNESRPGVTSAVLAPAQAARYMDRVLEKEPRISVVGIAGPGDPMANQEETLETIRRLHEKHPDLLFCLSSNGLALEEKLDELAASGVSHITVTVNAVDPAIGEKIYGWVRDGKVVYRGREGAELLLSRQLAAIRKAKSLGMIVKINTILIPGVNDAHVEDIAITMKELGVDILNVLPIKPVAGTPFGDLEEPSGELLRTVRAAVEKHLPLMRHCRRCRADAVGLLDNDRSGEFSSCLKECSSMEIPRYEARTRVAVASHEGLLVNQHLGEAPALQIWTEKDGGFEMIEERATPDIGGGPKRWEALAAQLKDCRALLCAALGRTPREVLEKSGVTVVEMSGFIEQGLEAIYKGGDLSKLMNKKPSACGHACGGSGEGC
ncbi:nitrogenase cofactor biosynthesis protein NifB [Oceanidesulfovibrio marinus]|uniref:FeMo cofactor biosynthesis protein NifB n=1 Tax=Oceanidesulfovibrio marinus TaxID=370038 RepID=A0ABX6NHM1_9BACT|nr:nitrogenase cofactor biosynthesis protein NifB [Oceanidesulfovibrio marinus]QJT10127.1 nitrogenase cofactor biosynthesis protein NifB [Oceanidesulfovibrio marinus]